MPAATALSRFTGPLLRRLPVVVAVAFGLYALALLAYYYVSWHRMHAETNGFLVADSKRRVSTLSALAEEIRNEAERHAELPEIQAYFLNRDLGMSLRYGLYASLQAIEDRFIQHSSHSWSESPSRIIFVGIEGNRLADTAPNFPLPADGITTKTRLEIDSVNKIISTSVPVFHKGNLEGNIVTIVSSRVLYRNLIGPEKDGGYQEFLLMSNGDMLSSDSRDSPFTAGELRALAIVPDDQVVALAGLNGIEENPRLTGRMLIKTPVPGLGINLMTLIQAERAHGHLASPGILFAAGLVPVLLLLGALRLDKMRIATEKLLMEMGLVEERRAGAERRNVKLAEEISRREQVEVTLKARTAELDAIFTLSPDGFVSFDQSNRVSYASPSFLRMTRLEDRQVIGIDENHFIALLRSISAPDAGFPEITELRSNEAKEAVSSGEMHRLTFTLYAPQPRVIETGVRSAKTRGSVSQVVYFRDITLETEVEQMKSEFLSTAAHELRTPMASVMGYAEVLLNTEFDVEARHEFIDTIHRNSVLMSKIVNELLDLSRIEARRGKDFNFQRVEIAPLLKEAVANFKPPEGRSDPCLELPPGHFPVRGDHSKLVQALTNLLSNAYKYSPAGGDVCVRLIEVSGDDGNTRIGLAVRDHGIGLTAEQQSRVCERFYRADDSGKFLGTGLGMSIVKEIIELHGGAVQIESEFGKGTTVTLWLPALPREDGTA
jgi:signal transduction histidine kinase